MGREAAIAAAVACLETGVLRDRLARRVALATESQSSEQRPLLAAYLEEELAPDLSAMGVVGALPEPCKAERLTPESPKRDPSIGKEVMAGSGVCRQIVAPEVWLQARKTCVQDG